MEKISWKPGTQFPVKAQVAADTVRRLQKKFGRDFITAKELLDDSRDENAPLHSCFEWDDAVAGELYRTAQARRIINSIVVQFIKDDVPTPPTRLFVNVQPVAPKNNGQFVAIDVVMKNDEYRKQVLQTAFNELQNFKRKYASYSELSVVFEAIDAFGDTIQ